MSFREGQGQRRFLERSNEVMEFSRNIARSKGQGQTSFPAKCVQLHVLIWYCSTCHARAVRQKKCTVSSSADYINRAATAITITTVLRSLHSTTFQHRGHAAVHQRRNDDAALVSQLRSLELEISRPIDYQTRKLSEDTEELPDDSKQEHERLRTHL